MPAAVIVEILKDDGTMARRPDLEKFARDHDLRIGTIADLIHYRIENEKTVERVHEGHLPTEYGEFRLIAYKDGLEDKLHFAMIKGEIDPEIPVMVRVHLANPICDLTGSLRENCGWPIRDILQRVSAEESGVVVILSDQVSPEEMIQQLEMVEATEEENRPKGRKSKDLRTIGLGAQILADVGVKKMRVLSAPKKIHAISGFGLEVVEYIS